MKRIFFSVFLIAAFGLTLNAKSSIETKHKVKKGETLYSISKNYGLKVNEIAKANPKLGTTLKVGQQIVIPHAGTITQVSNIRPKTVSVPSTPDTPYRDEDYRKHVSTTVAENASVAVNNDQPVVKKMNEEVHETVVAGTPTASFKTTSSNDSEYAAIFNQYASNGYKEKKNRGAANYLAESTSGNPYLALYNGAETGSVIKVTNMMNKKTVYVKVVGKVPPVDASKEVIIKLSHKAAIDLAAIDEKFLVEVVGFSAN